MRARPDASRPGSVRAPDRVLHVQTSCAPSPLHPVDCVRSVADLRDAHTGGGDPFPATSDLPPAPGERRRLDGLVLAAHSPTVSHFNVSVIVHQPEQQLECWTGGPTAEVGPDSVRQ